MRKLSSFSRATDKPHQLFDPKSQNLHIRFKAKLLAGALILSTLQFVGFGSAPMAAAALTWTEITSPSTNSWRDISTNSDGSVIAAVSDTSGSFYRSRDYGANWTSSTATSGLRTVAVSGNGNLAIAAHDNKIYRSEYSGSAWTVTTVNFITSGTGANQKCNNYNTANFNSIAASSDGTTWIAGARDENCTYISSDSGNSWLPVKVGPSAGNPNWGSAISGDGTKKITGNANNSIYRQIDTGPWTSISSAPVTTNGWWDVACDANCTQIAAVTNSSGKIYVSTDSGSTWSTSNSTSQGYAKVTMSSDGSKLAATNGGDIYVSQDSGATWITQGISHTGSFTSVVISKDGTKIYSATSDGHIWKSAFLANQSTLSVSNSSGVYGTPLTLATSGGSGSGLVSYTYVSGTGNCSVSGSTLTAGGVGTCVVTATKAADSTYNAATSSQATITFSAAPQRALSITSITGTLGVTLALTTSGGDGGGAISYVIDSGPCSLSGSSLNATSAGICNVTATKAAQGNYLAASSISTAITIAKGNPSITVITSGTARYGSSDTLTITTSIAGVITVSKSSVALSGCTNLQTVANSATCSWTPDSVGSTTLNLSFAPTDSANYSVASTSVIRSIAPALITVTPTAGQSKSYLATTPVITYSITSGQLVGNDSLSGSLTFTGTNVGTYPITIGTLANSNYTITLQSESFIISQATQTTPLVISTTSVTYGSTLTLLTSGGDGAGTNSFVVDSGPCTVSGSTLSATGAGSCYVTATKAAQGNYLAALSVSTLITVNPKSLTVSGLTGSNKEFDGTRIASAAGTPSLVGVVNSDDVLLGGTPVFTFASANTANGISLAASGYTLTGSTAGNYTLTQPTLSANITKKGSIISANNVTIAFGATVTSGVTAVGLISPDAIGSASYTYTGTGTSTPPTSVGIYTVTPSNAVLSTGIIGNYDITYETATVTILAKYSITFNANGGQVFGGSTSIVDFVVGDNALSLPTPSRDNYTFTGWYTHQSNGVKVTGAYTPTATATLWARWIQNSLYGMGTNTKVLTITTLPGVGNTYSANAGGGTIGIEYLADALPTGTVIDAYVLSDTSTATTLIGAGNDYVMSLVLAWVATDGTVPTTAAGKAISMTIANSSIKKGAKIYSVIGVTPTLLTIAAVDGSAVISITDDPQIIIAITKPDSPSGVSATSGGNASTTVSWTAPSDGGSAIISYSATSNAGQSCTSASTSCSVTGLTNGTPYTFTVTATNIIGTSDPSTASAAATPATPVVVTPPVVSAPSSGGGGSTYVAPTPIIDPAIAAAAAARALADGKAAEEKAAAEAKVLAEKKAAEEAALLAAIKALQEKADAESLAAAKRLQEELDAAQLKADEELKAAEALKLAQEQKIDAERIAAAKKITTVYSITSAFKLNTTYTKRLSTYTMKIAAGSTVTCIGYVMGSKTVSYAKAKTVATNQAKALCSSMKKIIPTLVTKSVVYPASKAPLTTVNKKWIPVSYRVEATVN